MSIRNKLTRRGLLAGAAALASFHALGDSITPQIGGGIWRGFDGGIEGIGNQLPSFYLGNIATRTMVPTTLNATITPLMTRRWHFARDTITSLQLVIPNFYVQASIAESGPLAGTTSITASIEYPAGTFTQVLFSGLATASVSGVSYVVSDPVAVSIPAGAKFYERIFISNSSGVPFTFWSVGGAGQPGISSGDNFNFNTSGTGTATDQTMSGSVTNNAGWIGTTHFGSLAIIAQTRQPSVLLIGDSRVQGAADTYDASGNLGELARTIGAIFGYVNIGVEGEHASSFVASHTARLAMAQYCSHIVIQLGVNDATTGRTSAQIIADRASIRALFPGQPCFETTIPTETSSTDNWTTTGNQTAINNAATRQAVNTSVRAGTVGMAGFFDIASITDTALSSSIWNADGVTAKKWTLDGIHETQFANLAIQTSGVVSTSLITRGSTIAPEATALFARMTTAPTSARQTLINNLIVSLKKAGVWDKLDAFYALAAADSQAAKLNWKINAFNLTVSSVPVFAVDTGYTGGTGVGFFTSGFIPSTAIAPNYTQNSACIFARSNTNLRADSSPLLGSTNTLLSLNPWNTGNNFGTVAINGTAVFSSGTPSTTKGLFTISRQASAAFIEYQDGTSLGSNVSLSTAVPSAEIRVLADASNITARQVSIAGFGGGLSAIDVANLSAAITAYLTALGVS